MTAGGYGGFLDGGPDEVEIRLPPGWANPGSFAPATRSATAGRWATSSNPLATSCGCQRVRARWLLRSPSATSNERSGVPGRTRSRPAEHSAGEQTPSTTCSGPKPTKNFETRQFETRQFETRQFEARQFEARQFEARQFEARQFEARQFETVCANAAPSLSAGSGSSKLR
jgi:hypothetical protein